MTIQVTSSNLCPNCSAPIATDDINLAQGVALCRACGKLSALSAIAGVDIASNASAAAAPLEQPGPPPPGCSVEQDGAAYGGAYGGPSMSAGGATGMTVAASTRSVPLAIFMLIFTLFWNGIVSVFIFVAAAGLYTNLIGPLPAWMPFSSSGGTALPLVMSIFFCVFLIPFVFVGLFTLGLFFTALAGSVRVNIRGADSIVSIGVGRFRWKRRFDSGAVRSITEEHSYSRKGGKTSYIVIESNRRIAFASMLNAERRIWMMRTLRMILCHDRSDGRGR